MTGEQVASLLAGSHHAPPLATCAAAAQVIEGLVAGYTRGRGVGRQPAPADLAAVALAAAARLAADTTQSDSVTLEVEGSRRTRVGSFRGWTLAELAFLNRWRRRAA